MGKESEKEFSIQTGGLGEIEWKKGFEKKKVLEEQECSISKQKELEDFEWGLLFECWWSSVMVKDRKWQRVQLQYRHQHVHQL